MNVPNEESSGEQSSGREVWRVVHLPQGGFGAHRVPYGTPLEKAPANACDATNLLYSLNSTAAELSLEEGHKRFAAFGFQIP